MAKVMGIINVNRESFYEGSRRLGAEDVEKAFTKMASEGAAIPWNRNGNIFKSRWKGLHKSSPRCSATGRKCLKSL